MSKVQKLLVVGGAFGLCVLVMFGLLVSVSRADYTTITVQSIDVDGMTPVYSDAVAGGVQFANDGRVFVHLKNTNAATYTANITTTYSEGGIAMADVTLTIVGTSGDVMAGPFPTKLFNNSSGMVQVGFSGVTDMDIMAFKLP